MDFAVVGLILLLVILVVAGFLVKKFVIEPAKASTTYRISERFGRDEIVRQQQFSRLIGLESTGLPDAPVLGTLVVSADRLYFAPTKGDDPTVDVPLADVIAVDLTTSHLGLSTGMPLLRVRFRTDGGEDAAAFHLPYTDEWHLAVTNLTKDLRSQ